MRRDVMPGPCARPKYLCEVIGYLCYMTKDVIDTYSNVTLLDKTPCFYDKYLDKHYFYKNEERFYVDYKKIQYEKNIWFVQNLAGKNPRVVKPRDVVY